MKRHQYFLLSLSVLSLVLLVSSCKKEEHINQFSATLETCTDGHEKTILNNNVLNWTDGDEIAVYGNSGRGVYSANLQNPASNAIFNHVTGECGNAPFHAYYPSTLTTDGIHVDLPRTQNSVDGRLTEFPMYATSNDEHLSFKNLCGVLKIHLQKHNTNIRSIKVTADSEINGSFSVQYNGVPTLSYEGYGNTSTTLYCNAYQSIDTGMDFYIYLPPGSYSDLTFTIINSEGDVCVKTSKSNVIINIVRSQYTSIVFGENDLVFTEYYPKILASLNPTNPLIAYIITEDLDTASIFGVKDGQGHALYLTSIVIKEHDKESPTEIFLDTLNRPTKILVSNGVIMLFNWINGQTAAVTLIDTVSMEQINTVVDYSSLFSDDSKYNTKDGNELDTSSTISRDGVPCTLTVEPIKTPSSHTSSKSGISGYVHVENCGVAFNTDCWVDVYKKSNISYYNYKYDMDFRRIHCNNAGTGLYTYTLPSELIEHHDELYTLCNEIVKVMGWICSPISAFGPSGTTVLCEGIAATLILLPEPATTAAGVKFAMACPALSASLYKICFAYDSPIPGSPSLSDYVCDLVRPIIEWDEPLYIIPKAITISGVKTGGGVSYYGNGGFPPDCYLPLGGEPDIFDFSLNPPAPAHGQSYVAKASLICIPPNTRITMSIVGTDGYKDSRTIIMGNDINYEATLHVPGAASGVRDVCTVNIVTPNGKTLQRTASLVFH